MKTVTTFRQINESNKFLPSEVIPHFDDMKLWPKKLIIENNGELKWQHDASYENNNTVNSLDFETLYIKDNRIGIGRFPLFEYKFDIALSVNKVETGMHIGDGTYGFSLGNGSNDGFIPQVIGMSAKKDESGLYFISRSGDEKNEISNIPLITFDCRNAYNTDEINRPLLGIKINGDDEYKMLITNNGVLNISGININGITLSEYITEEIKKYAFI